MPVFNSKNSFYQDILEFSKQKTALDLLDSGVDVNFLSPILTKIQDSITVGGNVNDLVSELEDYITGGDQGVGALKRYVSQVSSDSITQFNANYNQAVTSDLGFEFYKYTGTVIGNTRPFCDHFANKYLHKKEVEKLGQGTDPNTGKKLSKQDLKGRIKGTNSSSIFTYRGGWNCRHYFSPLPTRSVPKEILKKNLKNGNWKPTELELDRFLKGGKNKIDFIPEVKVIKNKPVSKSKFEPENYKNIVGEGADLPKEFWDKLKHKTPLYKSTDKIGSYHEGTSAGGKVHLQLDGIENPIIKKFHIAHEYGHAIHTQQRWVNVQAFSKTQGFSEAVPEFTAVFDKWRKRLGLGKNAKMKELVQRTYTRRIEEGLKEMQSKFGVSDELDYEYATSLMDTFGALTNGKVGKGHTMQYYKRANNGGGKIEFFAHASENKWVGNPYMKEMFPQLYRDMIEMWDELKVLK